MQRAAALRENKVDMPVHVFALLVGVIAVAECGNTAGQGDPTCTPASTLFAEEGVLAMATREKEFFMNTSNFAPTGFKTRSSSKFPALMDTHRAVVHGSIA